MSYLYDSLARYGKVYDLTHRMNPSTFLQATENYNWIPYNPRKNLPRWGQSITSLDGEMSGIPDLDSVLEDCIKNKVELHESDFNKKTPLWEHAKEALEPYSDYLGRTHVIKMDTGGCFPTHRDERNIEVPNFRLFIPIKNCNPPINWFVLDRQVLNFEHGKVYFIDTCLEHTVFTTNGTSVFIVANIVLCKESVEIVLSNLGSR